MRIKTHFIILCLAVSILFVDCSNSSRPIRDEFFTIHDMVGREVQLPNHIERIVGLRAGALRLLVYMDASDLVAGIEEVEKRGIRPYTLIHPEFMELPLIGPSMGGDAELICKAHPDVIFISYTTAGDADALQKKTGIPVVAIECPEMGTALDTLYSSFRLIGEILHKENRADSLISYIEKSLTELNIKTLDTKNTKKPTVYVGGVPYSGIHGISSTQPYFPPFMFVNANNVASSIDSRLISHVKGTYVDKEQILLWDPDVLFIDLSGWELVKQEISKNSPLHDLQAVKNNSIHMLLPYNNYAINYELVLINSWYAGKILYPEIFSDIDMHKKTAEILHAFFGEIAEEDVQSLTTGLGPASQKDF